MTQEASSLVYRREGYCPICEADAEFTARHEWFRDHLYCSGCGSIPRERALALVLSQRFPNWRTLSIHESSPGPRGISPKLKRECLRYTPTQFYPDRPLGQNFNGARNENLEVQTFGDESFDIVVTLDVMEHVNRPTEALREVARTLKDGGAYLFTVPTYKEKVISERRALYLPDGSVQHYATPEYHGNPVSDAGSLVTYHYGYDLAELIHDWSGMDVEVTRFQDHHHGIVGDFTEVYTATRRTLHQERPRPRSEPRVAPQTGLWPEDVRRMCEDAARQFGVAPEVHSEDFIFRFIYDHPGFESKSKAISYYFSDGAKSAQKVRSLIERWANPSPQNLDVLEFAAGYGAVTRHLRKKLHGHNLYSCDIHTQANIFVSQAMGTRTVQSASTPEELSLPVKFDVIFALSFFSHMPRSTWGRWLKRLFSGLREGGVLIFTAHGTTSMKYFADAQLDGSGYWFQQSSEQGDLDTAEYGQTITSKAFVDAEISELSGAEYVFHEPASWWEHQDLYIVRKK